MWPCRRGAGDGAGGGGPRGAREVVPGWRQRRILGRRWLPVHSNAGVHGMMDVHRKGLAFRHAWPPLPLWRIRAEPICLPRLRDEGPGHLWPVD